MSNNRGEPKIPNVVIVESEWKKPTPQVDQDNEEFWRGLKSHKLLLWRCKTCGATRTLRRSLEFRVLHRSLPCPAFQTV